MPSYSKNEIVLIRYPFSDLIGSKIRPAIVVSEAHESQDIFIVPLTSKITGLLSGEFQLTDWAAAGLNVPTTVKRGLITVHQGLAIKLVGRLSGADKQRVRTALRGWMGL